MLGCGGSELTQRCRMKYFVASGWILFTLFAIAGCSPARSETRPPTLPPATVIVAKPTEALITDSVRYTGHTDAVESVDIRSRVSGFLKSVSFEEGTEIEEGTKLYQIDDREYQADLSVATAELTSAQSRAAKASTDFNRAVDLKKKGAISEEDFDRNQAQKLEADAAVESANAALARRKLNVEFSTITAPISGRINRNLLSVGNLVTADATVLTSIVSVDPMYVFADVDERAILRIQKLVREGALEARKPGEIPILMGLANDQGFPYVGVVDFIDSRVNPGTGTIRIRGKFDNPRPTTGTRPLSPGLFANLQVPIGKPHAALLIAERAIGTDQGTKYVYIVNDKKEVERRNIELGDQHEGLREVRTGLNSDDLVIVDGLQRVRPGVAVDPKSGTMQSRSARGETSSKPEKTEEADSRSNSK